jgi:tetratricopeptide (TPR) repeat protein
MTEQEYVNSINDCLKEIRANKENLPIDEPMRIHLSDLIDRGLEEHPCSSRLWYIRGDLLQLLNGQFSDDMPFEEIVDCYSKSIMLNDNFQAHESLAYLYDVYSSDYINAEMHFRAAINLGAQLPSYLGLARVLAEAGRSQEALDILKGALEKYADQDMIQTLMTEIQQGLWR